MPGMRHYPDPGGSFDGSMLRLFDPEDGELRADVVARLIHATLHPEESLPWRQVLVDDLEAARGWRARMHARRNLWRYGR